MRRSFGQLAIIWALLLLSLWVFTQAYRSFVLTADSPRAVTARGALSEFEEQNVALFEQVAPSVVSIYADLDQERRFGRDLQRGAGTGSGFIWDAAGHVVTNHHVVQGASSVAVKLDDGAAMPARIVGVAPDHDLAVLRLRANLSMLQPIPIGTSSDLRTGQAVYAIGNPYGLSRTLTTGIISALERRLPVQTGREIRGVIQTDAAINPGNSGGPLLDSAGRLIGVNTAIVSDSGASAGIGFAVPVDVVNRIVPQLITRGKAIRPGIGITVAPAGASVVADGLVVVDVLPNGNAAAAGLRGVDPGTGAIGDVITHVNGEAVRNLAEFAHALENVGVGNAATLTVRRGGRGIEMPVDVADIS